MVSEEALDAWGTFRENYNWNILLVNRKVNLQRKGVIIIGGGCFSISGAIK